MTERGLVCPNCDHVIHASAGFAAGLTRAQYFILDFIAQEIILRQHSPSYAEIAAALGQRSRGSIGRRIDALEQRGYITRDPHKARAVVLTGKTLALYAARTQNHG